MSGKLANVWSWIKDYYDYIYRRQLFQHVAALSFYAVFAITPLFIVLIKGGALLVQDPKVHQQLISLFNTIAGGGVGNYINDFLIATGALESGRAATTFGLISLLFGALGLFGQLQKTLFFIWEDPESLASLRTHVWWKIKSLITVLVGVLIAATASIITTVIATTNQVINISGGWTFLSHLIDFIISWALLTIVFNFAFWIFTPRRVKFRKFLYGSMLSAFLFSIGKLLLSFYISNFGISSLYGALSNFIILLIWIYYASLVFLLGAVAVKLRHT